MFGFVILIVVKVKVNIWKICLYGVLWMDREDEKEEVKVFLFMFVDGRSSMKIN